MKGFLRKHRSTALMILFGLMFLTIVNLLVVHGLWYVTVANSADAEGRLEAQQRFQWGNYIYYRKDTDGRVDFTGKLIDGVELWAYPSESESAFFYIFYLPENTMAKHYIESFNKEMRYLISTLKTPPSAVASRELKLISEDWKIRQEAAEMLGKMRETARDAIPALIKSTKDEMPEVRATAAWALAMIGPNGNNDATIAALEELKKTPNAKMREVASRALERLRDEMRSNPQAGN